MFLVPQYIYYWKIKTIKMTFLDLLTSSILLILLILLKFDSVLFNSRFVYLDEIIGLESSENKMRKIIELETHEDKAKKYKPYFNQNTNSVCYHISGFYFYMFRIHKIKNAILSPHFLLNFYIFMKISQTINTIT